MEESKIKILFILPSLKAGGAERIVTTIATNVDNTKFESTLLVVGYAKDSKYETANIKTIFLNKSRVLKGVPNIFYTIVRTKPDIVMGSISHVNRVLAFLSIFFPKTKFIGREATVFSAIKQFSERKRKFNPYKHLFKDYFKNLDAVICQSNDMFNDIKTTYSIDQSKFVIINNPITDKFKLGSQLKTNAKIQYITVGSLHPRKGHDRILKALSKLDHDFIYTILGSGDKNSIETLSAKLNLADNIHYINYTDKVEDVLAENDVFLNGSYVEGFSNSMLESCAVGIPVVAFDAPGGINEIIIDGVNGHIANSEEEFVGYLNQINRSYNFDRQKVRESVTSRYDKKIILKQYEKLFTNLRFNLPLK